MCETEDPQLSRLPWCNVLVLFEPGPSVITLWLLLLFGSPPCSDYEYTQQMMSFAYDRHLPAGTTWRDLFDMVSGGGGARRVASGCLLFSSAWRMCVAIESQSMYGTHATLCIMGALLGLLCNTSSRCHADHHVHLFQNPGWHMSWRYFACSGPV